MIPEMLDQPLPMAFIGALPGALRAWARTYPGQGHAKAAADALIGVVFAIAIADWLTPVGYPKMGLLIGMFAALTGARALDAFFELVPELLRELALGWISKTFGRGQYDRHYPPRLPRERRLQNPDDEEP